MSCYIDYIDYQTGTNQIKVESFLNNLDDNFFQKKNKELKTSSLQSKDIISYMKFFLKEDYIYLFSDNYIRQICINLLKKYIESIESVTNIKKIYFTGEWKNVDVSLLFKDLVSYFNLTEINDFEILYGCNGWIKAVENFNSSYLNTDSRAIIFTNSVEQNEKDRLMGYELLSDCMGIAALDNYSKTGFEYIFSKSKFDTNIDEYTIEGCQKIYNVGINLIKETLLNSYIKIENINKVVLPMIYRSNFKNYAKDLSLDYDKILIPVNKTFTYYGATEALKFLKDYSKNLDGYILIYETSDAFDWYSLIIKKK